MNYQFIEVEINCELYFMDSYLKAKPQLTIECEAVCGGLWCPYPWAFFTFQSSSVIHTETVMNGVISILLSFFLHTFILAETVSDVTNSESLEEMMPLDQVETVEGFMRTREFKV